MDYQLIANCWLAQQPKIDSADTLSTLESKLELTILLGLALSTTSYSKNINIAKTFTVNGVKTICDVAGIPSSDSMEEMIGRLHNMNKDVGRKIAFIMLKYRNVIFDGRAHYVAKKPMVALCTQMRIVNDTAIPYTNKFCKIAKCGCSKINEYVMRGLYAYDVRYIIKDMQNELALLNIVPGNANPQPKCQSSSVVEQQLINEVRELKLKVEQNIPYKEVKNTQTNGTKQPAQQFVARAGGKWTPEEEEQLKQEINSGASLVEISKIHQRTIGAIQARLEKLGM